MIQLLQVNQSDTSVPDGRDRATLCEVSSQLDVETTATTYCVECEQNFCDQCSLVHRKLKMSKSHQVIDVKDKPSAEELIKMAVSYCEQHPKEEIKLYCNDCQTVTCLMCYVMKHNKHDCTDVKETTKKFSEQLSVDIENVATCTVECRRIVKEIEIKKKGFIEKVVSTQNKISERYDQLISLINSYQSQLIEELEVFKVRHLKEIETVAQEVEQQLVITESFPRYCQELKEKGTACHISRAANDLHLRAEELVKTQVKHGGVRLSQVKIMLTPSLSTTGDVKNLIGQLTFHGQMNTQYLILNYLFKMHCTITIKIIIKIM